MTGGGRAGGDDLPVLSDDGPGGADALRGRRRSRRILVGLIAVVLLLIGVTAAGIYFVTENVGNNVARLPNVFGPLADSPRPGDQAALTFLVVGTDTRSPEPTTGSEAVDGANPGSQRSDVIMLAELAPDRTSAAVVSIPRDSWVDIPGHGKNKINAAYAFGGPSLLTRTVEQLTDVRVDHFAVIDFAGFQGMVDAVGGIDVNVAQATSSVGVAFRQGRNHLDGADALVYVRQRHGLPHGDLDRAKREQNALKALLSEAVTGSTVTNPVQLYRFLDATSRAVSVDDTLTNQGFRDLAISSRALRPAQVTFLNAPISGFGREGAQDVDYLDTAKATALWSAVRSDTVGEYVTRYPTDRLGPSPF